MPTKVVLFYNLASGGFSETFYNNSDFPQTLATNIPNSFYQKAAALRSTSCILRAARFSRIGGIKQSILIRPSPIAQGKRGTSAMPGPDPISTTAVYSLQSVDGLVRRIFLRGLGDIDVTRDIFGNDVPSPDLVNLTNIYFGALFEQGMSIQLTNKPPALGLTWKRVIRVYHELADSGNRSWFFNIPNLPEFNVNDIIDFAGMGPGLPKFPRRARILQKKTVDGNANYQIAYGLPGGVSVEPQNGRCQILPKQYSPISLWYFERFSEHKTGRPFGSLRGRSRATALRL